MWYKLDENRKPVAVKDPTEAYALLEEDRRVGLTTVGGYTVSTVFLALDHGHGLGSKPVLFETMIFGPDEEQSDTHRYCEWDEAKEGHDRVVAALCKRLGMQLTDTKEIEQWEPGMEP